MAEKIIKNDKNDKNDKTNKDIIDFNKELGLDTTNLADAKAKVLNPQLKATVQDGDKRIIYHPIGRLVELSYGVGKPHSKGYYKDVKVAFLYLTIEGVPPKAGLCHRHTERFSSFVDRSNKDNDNLLFIEDNFNILINNIYKECFSKGKQHIVNLQNIANAAFNEELAKVGFKNNWITKEEDNKIKIINKPEVLNLKHYYMFKTISNDLNTLIKEVNKNDKIQWYSWFITTYRKNYQLQAVLPYNKGTRTEFKGEETASYDVEKDNKAKLIENDLNSDTLPSFDLDNLQL